MKPKTAPEKAPSPPRAVHQVKSSLRRSDGMAEGGKTPMAGKGTRTITEGPDSAGPVVPARTAQPASATKGPPRAAGGPSLRSHGVGGVSRPARPGSTGT
jgi:hypothetical protein